MNRFEKLCIEYVVNQHQKLFDDKKEILCECKHSDLLENEILAIDIFETSTEKNIEIFTDIANTGHDTNKTQLVKQIACINFYLSEAALNDMKFEFLCENRITSIQFFVEMASIYYLAIPKESIDTFIKKSSNPKLDQPLIEWLEDLKMQYPDKDYVYLKHFIDSAQRDLTNYFPRCPLTQKIFPDLFGFEDIEENDEDLDTLEEKGIVGYFADNLSETGHEEFVFIDEDMFLNILESYNIDHTNSNLILPSMDSDSEFRNVANTLLDDFMYNNSDDLLESIGYTYDDFGSMTEFSMANNLGKKIDTIVGLFWDLEITTPDEEIFYTITLY